MPFARSEVITLLANLSTSFKISSAKQWIGSILSDRNAAVSGEIGRKANLIPVTVNVKNMSRPGSARTYKMNFIRDRFLSPLLLQMAVSEQSGEPAADGVGDQTACDAGEEIGRAHV